MIRDGDRCDFAVLHREASPLRARLGLKPSLRFLPCLLPAAPIAANQLNRSKSTSPLAICLKRMAVLFVRRVLVGVSGGKDSLSLIHVLLALQVRPPIFLPRVAVLAIVVRRPCCLALSRAAGGSDDAASRCALGLVRVVRMRTRLATCSLPHVMLLFRFRPAHVWPASLRFVSV